MLHHNPLSASPDDQGRHVDVPISDFVQLFISYCEVLDTLEKRQTHLSMVYHFQCACLRCQKEEGEAALVGARTREAIREGYSMLDGALKTSAEKNDILVSGSLIYVPTGILIGVLCACRYFNGFPGNFNFSPGVSLCAVYEPFSLHEVYS